MNGLHFRRHEDGRTALVPAHRVGTIGPGALPKIPRDH
jgi:predicted RNA binding protein YcfA (HicA-like mRNA interferase family)